MGVILPTKGHLVLSEHIFGCHTELGVGNWPPAGGRRRGSAQHPTHRTELPPKAGGATVEEPWFREFGGTAGREAPALSLTCGQPVTRVGPLLFSFPGLLGNLGPPSLLGPQQLAQLMQAQPPACSPGAREGTHRHWTQSQVTEQE